MLLFALLAHIFLPVSIIRPVCNGVRLAADTSITDGSAEVHVFGCATGVTVTCEAPVAASLPAHILIAGDAIRVGSPIPMATGGTATCALSSDQGRVVFGVSQP